MRKIVLCLLCCGLAACAPKTSAPPTSSGSSMSIAPGESESMYRVSPLNTDTFRFVVQVGNDKTGEQELWVLDESGKFDPIYKFNEKLPDDSIIFPRVLSRDGRIFLAAPAKDDFHVIDFTGEDMTRDFPFFKGKTYDVESYFRIDPERFAYTLHSTSRVNPDDLTGLFIADNSGKVIRHFAFSNFGIGDDLTGVSPVCLSFNRKALFVRYVPWEGFSYDRLWKVDLADGKITPVITESDKTLGYHCLDSTRFIVRATAENDPSIGMGGMATAPSSIVLDSFSDTTTHRTLVSSDDTLVHDPVITPDEMNIFYIETTAKPHPEFEGDPMFFGSGAISHVHVMDKDGENNRDLGEYGRIMGISPEGNVLIVQREQYDDYPPNQHFFVIDVPTGKATPLPFPKDARMQVLQCPYGMGFNCMYVGVGLGE